MWDTSGDLDGVYRMDGLHAWLMMKSISRATCSWSVALTNVNVYTLHCSTRVWNGTPIPSCRGSYTISSVPVQRVS